MGKKKKEKKVVQLLFLKGNLGKFPPPQEITVVPTPLSSRIENIHHLEKTMWRK